MSDVQPVDRKGDEYEKDGTSMVEHKSDVHYQPEDPLPPPGTPERIAAERRLVRKLDMRVLPTIIVIYIMNYIDRNGITTARLQGLEEDLHLSGDHTLHLSNGFHLTHICLDIQYSAVLSILYVTYCPAQIPSNMALNYVTRPSWYIGACVVAWGLVSAMTGVTHNFGGLLACRMFIGLPEAAFYPGEFSNLLTVKMVHEEGTSFSFCYSLCGTNAFECFRSRILAEMEGKRGIRAWRWLFFIEGAITIFVGLNAMWLLPDYPNNTRWISAADRRLAQARIADDAGEADKDNESDSLLHGLKLALADPKVLTFAVMTMSQLLGLSFVNFFPTLTQTLGFNTTISLVLAAPPWLLGTVICCLNAWHADRTGERFFHIAGWWWGVITGFIIALATMNTAARYISMIFMAFGYAGFSMTLVWVANTVPRPPAKRAAAIGIVNGTGNLGNLIGSFVWKAQWGPEYHQSMVISLCGLVLSSVLALTLRQMLVRENKRLDADELQGANRARVEEAAKLEGISFEEALERRKGFRYLY
ncbi:tartrate transporter [Moniliophthora roreri]|nr:tartrate transporter [Moniliophthora roreri]